MQKYDFGYDVVENKKKYINKINYYKTHKEEFEKKYTPEKVREHLYKCKYGHPYLCDVCDDIFILYKEKYKITKFYKIYEKVGVPLNYKRFKGSYDREVFLKMFNYLLYKELKKYTSIYKKTGVSFDDFRQDAFVILLEMFEQSYSKEENIAQFLSYVSNYFPLKLLKKFLEYKKKREYEHKIIDDEVSSYITTSMLMKDNGFIHKNKISNKTEIEIDIIYIQKIAKKILKEDMFNIFNLYYVYKYRTDDISLLLGKTKKQIINRLSNIRKKIKKYIERINNV